MGIRTTLDKELPDVTFNIVNHSQYHGYQRCLASTVYRFFIKNCSRSGAALHGHTAETDAIAISWRISQNNY